MAYAAQFQEFHTPIANSFGPTSQVPISLAYALWTVQVGHQSKKSKARLIANVGQKCYVFCDIFYTKYVLARKSLHSLIMRFI